jgi:3-oxoacyl-[acyl-carrier protein] reductase
LRHSKHGRIINISSLAGRTGGVAVGAHYSVSKAGVLGLTKVLARLLADDGTTVNCIAPGTLETALTASWKPETKELLREKTPMKRLGSPEDVAAAALYFASDSASFVTGATLDVNGGIAMM